MARIGVPRGGAIGLAVSGGGDSVALMRLAIGWARAAPHVATVDHGLREGSAEEVRAVAAWAGALGLSHEVLRWSWDGSGNLQAAAREGRRALLTGWAERRGLPMVLLGHTRDDQAETLVMRLARGSGVEGLSAMAEGRWAGGAPSFGRPLLAVPRADLRDWLRARGADWIEDPSNEDDRFERVRARRAIEALGLDRRRLADTAARMGRAREALEARAFEVASRACRPALGGEVALSREGLRGTDEDTRLRILAGALMHVSGVARRPREEALRGLAGVLAGGGAGTLHGCVARAGHDALLIHREPRAVLGLAVPADGHALWDGAWGLGAHEGCEVRALGEAGLARIAAGPGPSPGSRPWSPRASPGHPRAALAAKPALWRGGDLVGFAPLRWGAAHAARWQPARPGFPEALLTRR